MALIVEDGSGKTDAESYISVSDATAYHAARGNAAWAALASDTVREQALRAATDYMLQAYRYQWAGSRKTATQALDWPRIDVPRLDTRQPLYSLQSYYDESSVPTEVARACAVLALKASTGELAPDIGRIKSREKVDVIEVEYQQGAAPYVRYRAVDNLLAGMLKTSSGSLISLVRA
jgi:hypothetical protein